MSLSSYDSGYSSVGRLEVFRTQHELAKNFYDDIEFCPLSSFEEVRDHRDRIQQRSPYTSPRSSPPIMYRNNPSPPKRRAIPIINPDSMTPVSILPQAHSNSPPLSHYQQQQQHYHHHEASPPMAHWQAFQQQDRSFMYNQANTYC
ncbi:hypothetical protein BJ944DRAFT_272113 [Cunninghamella echinulata]|nr:hypothetical protein BJ944DRAFT_272113 [Cunninghamella echinulata]